MTHRIKMIVVLLSLAMCSRFVGCAERDIKRSDADSSSGSVDKRTHLLNREQPAVLSTADMQRLLSPDPSLSVAELARAIEFRDYNAIHLAWLLSDVTDVREKALEYLLAREEDMSEHFKGILSQLAKESSMRIEEVERVVRMRERNRVR